MCVRVPKEIDGVEDDRLKFLRKIFGREWEEVTVEWGNWKNRGRKNVNTPPRSCYPLEWCLSPQENHLFNPLNSELNPICYLLALLGAHHFLHVSRIRVKSLILRLLMSYIYGAPILDVSGSHTTTQHIR